MNLSVLKAQPCIISCIAKGGGVGGNAFYFLMHTTLPMKRKKKTPNSNNFGRGKHYSNLYIIFFVFLRTLDKKIGIADSIFRAMLNIMFPGNRHKNANPPISIYGNFDKIKITKLFAKIVIC